MTNLHALERTCDLLGRAIGGDDLRASVFLVQVARRLLLAAPPPGRRGRARRGRLAGPILN